MPGLPKSSAMSVCPLPSVKVSIRRLFAFSLLSSWDCVAWRPRYIAADWGVSNMGVKAVYGLPLPVFFDLETWRPNHSVMASFGRGFVEAFV